MRAIKPLSFRDIIQKSKPMKLGERWEADDSGVEIIEPAPDKIEKFNPHHDAHGRFATRDGGVSFTIRTKDPNKQHWADMAVAREKDRSKKEPERIQTDHPEKGGVDGIMEQCGVDRYTAGKMDDALTSFTGSDFVDIRHAQRGDQGKMSDAEFNKFRETADTLEQFIEASPQWRGSTLWRGVKMGGDEFDNITEGAVIGMKGVSSWSSSETTAKQFTKFGGSDAKKVIFHTDDPGKATSVKPFSQFSNEDEVLVSNSNSFKIVSVTTDSMGVKHAKVKFHETTSTKKSVDFHEALKKNAPTPQQNRIETENPQQFDILKTDEDKRLVFGWASIAITADGEQLVDLQKDIIDPEDLEESVYNYVLEFRDAGEEHIGSLRKKGSLVESVMFTKEKMKAMGIPEGIVPEGWWIGFYVKDDDAWEKIKNGTYQMFSIEGKAIRKEVEDDIGKADRINGCGILVIKDGKILTGTRIGGKHGNQICGPGGHIEHGETHEQAAMREAQEEFGIKCKELVPLGILDGGRNYGKSAVFLCTEYDGEPRTDEEEMTGLKWRTPSELEEERLFYPFEQSLDLLAEQMKKATQPQKTVAKSFYEIIKQEV